MSALIHPSTRVPTPGTRMLLIKWIVALIVPLAVFTFWGGEAIVNTVLAPQAAGSGIPTDSPSLAVGAVFTLIFYLTVFTLAGYLVAADTGRRGMFEVWIDIVIFTVVPLLLVILTNLVIGLALCAIVWPVYFFVRRLIRKRQHYVPPSPLDTLTPLDTEQRTLLRRRAIAGSVGLTSVFAVVTLIADVIYFFLGSLQPTYLLIWVAVRTLLLPVLGYFLGRLAGRLAVRRTLGAQTAGNGISSNGGRKGSEKRHELEVLSETRAREEARDLVPNDLPLQSRGAQRFYLLLLGAFVLFYPVLDPFLFGSGTDGRLSGYGDAGYYVILALGLNIVVGFAGLLDLGYVAFFAIGAYSWAIVGSPQLGRLIGVQIDPNLWPWLFWPMLLGSALIAALWGVVLGAPTLRLRGDYLAIVTLGFGEIIPIVFTEMDKYTNGPNGLVNVSAPGFPGVDWSTSIPFYYLILALIVLVIFANIRLRDSRLGRAWIAIREDEVAAASSGINLVNTKLFAFGAGAFFSGVAGAYHSAKLGGISSDAFSFGDSVLYLSMVVIGGLGSIPGVIVGALAVYALNQFVVAQLDTIGTDPGSFLHPIYTVITNLIPGFTFGNIRNLIFGVILVSIMIFRPEGLIPSARRRRELHHSTEDGVEMGALDVIPGAPGFETEVGVDQL
ncbi:MAG: branched-chain amino acid ABC transporter permease [Chloroflexota bacterium]|nr:branched-chain amino acid ABC transporter permease [Chloroflexota bacterium]